MSIHRRLTFVLFFCVDKFPSSVAFDAINEALQSSDADRKDAIKQGNAVFAFTLKNKAGETESWHIDLKEKGAVGSGVGTKPTGKQPVIIQSLGGRVALDRNINSP